MIVSQHFQTDRNGRRYPVYVCDQGHWHRGRRQAVKCNAKHRGGVATVFNQSRKEGQ